MELINEKKEGQKSRVTLPLIIICTHLQYFRKGLFNLLMQNGLDETFLMMDHVLYKFLLFKILLSYKVLLFYKFFVLQISRLHVWR